MRFFSTFLSTLLIPLVAVMPLRAELSASDAAIASTQPASVTTAAATTPDQASLLKVRLADDSKATVQANSIVKGYAILVTDASGLPVPDAAVAIRFPDEGATGFFVNGEHSGVAYTDASGVAKFPQVNWGSATGTLAIRVTAVKGELHAGALIEQTVVAQLAASQAGKSAPVAPTASVPNVQAAPSSTPVAEQAKAKAPGVPTSVAAIHSGAAPDEVPLADKPPASDSVSVVNTAGSRGGGANTKKWVALAAVLGAVGVAAALAAAGKGSGPGPSPVAPTTTIGTPTISVGH